MSPLRGAAAVLAAAGALTVGTAAGGCADGAGPASDRAAATHSRAAMSVGGPRFPELLNVRPVRTGPRTYDFLVLLRTTYASPSRFAAGWRVLAPSGEVLAVKRLARPYLGDGSFWRRQTGVRVPRGVRSVRLQARDSVNGYGGRGLTVGLP